MSYFLTAFFQDKVEVYNKKKKVFTFSVCIFPTIIVLFARNTTDNALGGVQEFRIARFCSTQKRRNIPTGGAIIYQYSSNAAKFSAHNCINAAFRYCCKYTIVEFWNLELLVFPMLPRNQRVRMALSIAEAQTSGQKNGIPDFRLNAPYALMIHLLKI